MSRELDAVAKPARGRGPEVFFFAAGVLLLGFAGGATLLGRFQKGRDLLRFREALAAPAPAIGAPASVAGAAPDTRLWSPERIKAYAESRRAANGAPLAVLRIPKIGLEVPVLDGTDELTLNRAVGLIEDTARPGESGNVGIAGHRDGFFRGLMDVKTGDALELETLGGKTSYAVQFVKIVQPDDVSVLDATPGPALTLVTCYPFYYVGSAPQRYIVRAVATPTRTSSLPGTGREPSLVRSR